MGHIVCDKLDLNVRNNRNLMQDIALKQNEIRLET